MRRSATHLVLALLVVTLLPGVAWAVLQPRSLRAHLVRFDGLSQPEPGLYLGPAFGAAEVAALKASLTDARQRIAPLFGAQRAHPVIIAARSPEIIERYGNIYGAMHASPFGAAVVVFGPEGLASPDILAHELAHAEHLARIGYWKYWLGTPMWFFEGVGMQVDHRERYGEAAWRAATNEGRDAPALASLRTGRGFFRGDLTLHYATARFEVARFLRHVGPEGLRRFLATQPLWGFDAHYASALGSVDE